MTAIERRLARELHEAAADIDAGSVPPLVLPSGPARFSAVRPSFGRRSGAGQSVAGRAGRAPADQEAREGRLTPRLLAPLAAAASVLAIAAGVGALGSLARPHGGTSPATTSGLLRSVPPYYVALTESAPLTAEHRHVAGIYATRTGDLIASIAVPAPYRTFVDVSAAASDRTFALAAMAYPRQGMAAVMFYLARFSPSDGSVRLTALTAARMPGGASFDGFALSPDGRELAVAYEQPGTGGSVTEVLNVLDVASGTVWTWTSTQGTVAGAGLEPHPLSWAAGGRTLAFAWHATGAAGERITAPRASGVRLLRIASRDPGLVASSRLSVRLYTAANQPDPAGLIPSSAMLAPGGRVLAAAGTDRSATSGGFKEFSATTGQPVRTLWWKPFPDGRPPGEMAVLWASPSGRTLVVSGPPGHPGRIAVLRAGQLVLLPGPAGIALPAAAW